MEEMEEEKKDEEYKLVSRYDAGISIMPQRMKYVGPLALLYTYIYLYNMNMPLYWKKN